MEDIISTEKIFNELDTTDKSMLINLYLMDHKKVTQAEVADMLGISRVQLSRILNGVRSDENLDKSALLKMLLDTNVEDMYGRVSNVLSAQARIQKWNDINRVLPLIIQFFEVIHPDFQYKKPENINKLAMGSQIGEFQNQEKNCCWKIYLCSLDQFRHTRAMLSRRLIMEGRSSERISFLHLESDNSGNSLDELLEIFVGETYTRIICEPFSVIHITQEGDVQEYPIHD